MDRLDRFGNRGAVGFLRVFMIRRLLKALLVLNRHSPSGLPSDVKIA